MSRDFKIIMLVIGLFVAAVVVEVMRIEDHPDQMADASPSTPSTAPAMTVAQQVASLDAHRSVGADELAVKRMDHLLDSLSRRTGVDDRKAIASMAANAQKLERDKFGREMTLAQLLEAANRTPTIRSRDDLVSFFALTVVIDGQ